LANFFAGLNLKKQNHHFGIFKETAVNTHIHYPEETGTGKTTFVSIWPSTILETAKAWRSLTHGDFISPFWILFPLTESMTLFILDPSDMSNPFHINPLEIDSSVQKLVASGIVGIFFT